MIYKIDETFYNSVNESLIIAYSNIGCSFLIQADSCSVDFIESFDDSKLDELISNEPYLDVEEPEEYEELDE